MNRLFELNLSLEELVELGAKLGADVPACLYDTPVIARGIGEQIEKLESKAKFYIVLIKPEYNCNTKEMYQKIDTMPNLQQKNTTNMVKQALKENKIEKVATNLYNVFEETLKENEQIQEIKRRLLENKAMGVQLTGSGSCVFGIFNKEDACSAYQSLKPYYSNLYLVPTYNKGKYKNEKK